MDCMGDLEMAALGQGGAMQTNCVRQYQLWLKETGEKTSNAASDKSIKDLTVPGEFDTGTSGQICSVDQ